MFAIPQTCFVGSAERSAECIVSFRGTPKLRSAERTNAFRETPKTRSAESKKWFHGMANMFLRNDEELLLDGPKGRELKHTLKGHKGINKLTRTAQRKGERERERER